MKRRIQGFSLIELMVAVTLGLVLLAGVAQVFVNSKQGYRVQESVGRLQENARFATEVLSRYIRVADLWGGAKADAVKLIGPATLPAVNHKSNCANSWILDPSSGIVGYAGDDGAGNNLSYPANGFPAGCLDNYVPGSDVLAIRFADPDTYLDTASLTNTSEHIANGSFYVRALTGARAELFDLTGASLATVQTDIPGNSANGVLNYQFQTIVFYLQTNDLGQGPTATLAMLHLQSNGLISDPLVDGIEMIKFEYGIDSDGDFSVDRYLPASAALATPSVINWSQVLSVRVSLIVRGDALDNYIDTQTYQMTQGYRYGPAQYGAVANGAHFQRRLVIKEIQLRNRVRQ